MATIENIDQPEPTAQQLNPSLTPSKELIKHRTVRSDDGNESEGVTAGTAATSEQSLVSGDQGGSILKESESDQKSDMDESADGPRRHSSVEWIFDPEVTNVGAIDLAFPENPDPQFLEAECLPVSYYTLNAKERLLLAYAENFRRQFVASEEFTERRPLVLAVKNECDVQKFVCTTIRPAKFLFSEFFGNWQGIANFVADFIIYEPLKDPLCIPSRLISPEKLLRHRRGNSYEMATLLCSMLAGEEFAAMVVSGSATLETTINDQRRVVCPVIPSNLLENETVKAEKPKNKYELKRRPKLESKFLTEMEEKSRQIELDEEKAKEQEAFEKEEALGRRPADGFLGRRMHAWVVIIENAPWCHKPREKVYNDEGAEITPEPTAFFIEPSTGFRHEVSSSNYLRIDSIWNQHNYYVNRQEPTENGLKDMKWDLGNSDHWDHVFLAEPFDLRIEDSMTQDDEHANFEEVYGIEKHMDLLPSWVQKLRISLHDFENCLPNGEKFIYYKKALLERYSPYLKYDGLMKRLTYFEDFDYTRPTIRWEWYENRADQMYMLKLDFETKQIEESFLKGRPDCLKYYIHNAIPDRQKVFHFYSFPRLDALKVMEITMEKYVYYYEETRDDFVNYQEFHFKPKDRFRCQAKSLTGIIEKCCRNEKQLINQDVAVRQFLLAQSKISLKFQYAYDAITRSTRDFTKPPKPDYGDEIKYDPALTTGYNANPQEKPPTSIELYDMLLRELKKEESLKKQFEKRCVELDELVARRKTETFSPRLLFSVFDRLRNEGAKILRLKEYEEERLRKELAAISEPDFLAPYLVAYEKRKPNSEESWAAFNACLSDVKTAYLDLLNELQLRYQDLTAEAKSLKKFMARFQDQFDDFDYDRLMKEAKDIELNKRMVQQRLITTHEEAQRKYRNIRESLMTDERLHLTI